MGTSSKIKVHLSVTRPGIFGGELTTSLCNRLRTMLDGMNLTGDEAKVTCKFCLARLEARRKRDATAPSSSIEAGQ